jgi:Phytanoyl-CoA dioxygenase (PhyH)
MPIALDRRTRRDADLRRVRVDEFIADDFPGFCARHGALVARAIAALDAPPLALEIGGRSWSFSGDGTTLHASPGVRDGALVVTFDEEQFSDWVQNQRSFNAMLTARELRYRGSLRDVSTWDSLWLALLEGWPVVDDTIEFLDRAGSSLDLSRAFTPDDDPADIAHFLREAGFLHLSGWLDPEDMDEVSGEIDRARPGYREGDGRSWWATLDDGTRTCVRLQEFAERSPTTTAILRSDRWDQLRRALAGEEELIRGPVEGRIVEALVKPVGVVAGVSDVSFHRDCHFGRHAYTCASTVVGIAVTPSSEVNGLLRVIAGSHRVLMPVEIAKSDPYLPVIAAATEPGDITVHLSCTLHEATPPLIEERRVMYTGFSLPPREEGPERGGGALRDLRERVYKIDS